MADLELPSRQPSQGGREQVAVVGAGVRVGEAAQLAQQQRRARAAAHADQGAHHALAHLLAAGGTRYKYRRPS